MPKKITVIIGIIVVGAIVAGAVYINSVKRIAELKEARYHTLF